MSESQVAEPPAAPTPTPAPPAPQPSGSAVPSSQGEINVQQLTQAPEPARPGTRKSKMYEELQKKANKGRVAETPKPEPQKAPAPEVKEETQEELEEPKETPKETPKTETDDLSSDLEETPETKEQEKAKKPSPWKIAEEYKKRSSQLEKELAELKSQSVVKKEYETLQTNLEELKKKSAEMEEELRFVNYQKSDEFKKQYQEPYESAWKRAMDELSEITVDAGDGSSRQVHAQDLLQLVNLPLPKAREAAKQMFGDFADDVMVHRKEIKNLFDAQVKALDEAKATGMEREKQRAMEHQTRMKETTEFVSKSWQEANSAIAADEKFGKYFSEDPQDQEGNQRLKKGFEIVDKAWAEDSMDPRHTPEQRAKIIRNHAMIRNRAAAFGKIVGQNRALEKQIAELTEELNSYKSSEPSRKGSESSTPQPQGRVPWRQRIQGELEKRARR